MFEPDQTRPDLLHMADPTGPMPAFVFPEPAMTLQGGSLEEAEQNLAKARRMQEELYRDYEQTDCPAVVEYKQNLDLLGGLMGWVSLGTGLFGSKLAFRVGLGATALEYVAEQTGNRRGLRHTQVDCERIQERIERQQMKLEQAHQEFVDQYKTKYGIFSAHVTRKRQRETQIRDWRNYQYDLEVYRKSLNPAAPEPRAPVYAFAASPQPSEREMSLVTSVLKARVA